MQLIEEIKELLGDNLLRSGAAFYSSCKTLKKGKYLILGLNPGGDPNKITSTIANSLEVFKNENYNEYYEPWLEEGKMHRLQYNLCKLFKFLGHDLRDVCATNLFYERSRRENQLSFESLPIYKTVLGKVLQVVQPEVIITF